MNIKYCSICGKYMCIIFWHCIAYRKCTWRECILDLICALMSLSAGIELSSREIGQSDKQCNISSLLTLFSFLFISIAQVSAVLMQHLLLSSQSLFFCMMIQIFRKHRCSLRMHCYLLLRYPCLVITGTWNLIHFTHIF